MKPRGLACALLRAPHVPNEEISLAFKPTLPLWYIPVENLVQCRAKMCQAKSLINFDLPIVRQIGNANRGEIHLGNRSQTLLQPCFPPNQDG